MLSRSKLRELRGAPTAPNRLRVAMRLAGVTQTQLSESIGLAQSQISEDMAGKYSDLSLEKARDYAAFFGCSVDDLFPASQAIAS